VIVTVLDSLSRGFDVADPELSRVAWDSLRRRRYNRQPVKQFQQDLDARNQGRIACLQDGDSKFGSSVCMIVLNRFILFVADVFIAGAIVPAAPF
jgi:hypothetical protein